VKYYTTKKPRLSSGNLRNPYGDFLRYVKSPGGSKLEPVIASLLAFAALGERLDAGQLLGAVLILVAVISLTRAPSA
jgi:hypothetical protein